MRKIALTLLGTTAAIVMMPMAAHAQTASTMSPALDCGPPVPDQSATPNIATPTIPGTPPIDTGTTTGGVTSTGGTTGGTTTGGGTTGGTTTGGITVPVGGVTGGGSTPTVVPSPTPTPTPTPPTTGGVTTNQTEYVTNPNVARMTKTFVSDELGDRNVYRATSYTPGYGHADVTQDKSYRKPTVGFVRNVGGSYISVANTGVNTTGFNQRIIDAFDEMVLVARAVGVHDPIITAGVDAKGHTTGSIHSKGLAVDLRANDMSAADAKKYVMALKQALGPGYDVMYENWGTGNTHIHLEYDGKTP